MTPRTIVEQFITYLDDQGCTIADYDGEKVWPVEVEVVRSLINEFLEGLGER